MISSTSLWCSPWTVKALMTVFQLMRQWWEAQGQPNLIRLHPLTLFPWKVPVSSLYYESSKSHSDFLIIGIFRFWNQENSLASETRATLHLLPANFAIFILLNLLFVPKENENIHFALWWFSGGGCIPISIYLKFHIISICDIRNIKLVILHSLVIFRGYTQLCRYHWSNSTKYTVTVHHLCNCTI